VGFGDLFMNTVTPGSAFPGGGGNAGLLPLLNLEIWGLPTSQPAADPANGSFIYQRFQRGVFMYDAGSGLSQPMLLADYFKAVLTGENLPPDLDEEARGSPFYRLYAPSAPASVSRPDAAPGTDLTGAFEPGAVGLGGAQFSTAQPTIEGFPT